MVTRSGAYQGGGSLGRPDGRGEARARAEEGGAAVPTSLLCPLQVPLSPLSRQPPCPGSPFGVLWCLHDMVMINEVTGHWQSEPPGLLSSPEVEGGEAADLEAPFRAGSGASSPPIFRHVSKFASLT